MATATWNGKVIAQSDDIVRVEGNAYFPPEAVDPAFLRPSTKHTVCSWKGVASYHDVVVDGAVNADAAWFYPEPKPEAARVAGRIAFWKGVQVVG